MLQNEQEKVVVALNLYFPKALVRTGNDIILYVGGFCFLCSVFASLELDFLSNELIGLTAAVDWTHLYTINLDKTVCTEESCVQLPDWPF